MPTPPKAADHPKLRRMLQDFTAWAAATAFLLAAIGLSLPAAGQVPTAFYQTESDPGTPAWWLPPGDKPTLLFGVDQLQVVANGVRPGSLPAGAVERRAGAIVAQLKQWHFNAVGPGSDAELWRHGLPYIESLDLWNQLLGDQSAEMIDVYKSDFVARVRALVQIAASPRVDDHTLIGYITDIRLAWDPDGNPGPVLSYYLRLPYSAPGKTRVMDFLRNRYHDDIGALNRAWGSNAKDFLTLTPPDKATPAFTDDARAFADDVLARYEQAAAAALHTVDPNHEDLGAILTPPAKRPEPGSAAGTIWSIPDVITIRLDPGRNNAAAIRRMQTISPRPLMIEFDGCGPVATATPQLATAPMVVGYLWNPGPGWNSGACADQGARVWARFNRVANTQHQRPQNGLLP